MNDFDIIIVGAGIAGASLAAEIAASRSVLLLEAEAQPGYHSTGRSAAFWAESYGGPDVQPLTTASGPFLAKPPADFHDGPLLHSRGALYIGTPDDAKAALEMLHDFERSGVQLERFDSAAAARHIPGLLENWTEALWEPDCCDIDVAALHAAYLRRAKRDGAKLICNAPLKSAKWQNGAWQIETGGGIFSGGTLVNAAGAWADAVAAMAGVTPLDIRPHRRTIVQLTVEPSAPAALPLVIGLDGSFYFKSDAGGRLWLSPHDETPCPPCDAAPEELDIAIAIDRLQQVVDWRIGHVEHKWAGLRSFAPDRLPVIGCDTAMPAFFWLAGQGGFGIQTAPAVAQLAASLLSEAIKPPSGIDAERYAPKRF
ncbi:MAG: FAD-dependent oxidoreductase [Sphingorhabdus sp.]